MQIEYDEKKRQEILDERGLDHPDAVLVFADEHYQIEDNRKDYGEERFRVWGFLHGRRISLVWTPRGNIRRIITMRHVHESEHEIRFRTLD